LNDLTLLVAKLHFTVILNGLSPCQFEGYRSGVDDLLVLLGCEAHRTE
jgi:hypothetical protein